MRFVAILTLGTGRLDQPVRWWNVSVLPKRRNVSAQTDPVLER